MEFISNHKKAFLILVALVCVVCAIITLNFKRPTFIENIISFFLAPTQQAATGAGEWVSSKIDFVSNMHELEKLNKELLAENERLKIEVSRVGELERENENLANQLNLKSRYPKLPLMGAYVIATDVNNWSRYFTISKGTNDGIKENMVVLADGGLVGKIYKANPTGSLVIPITDDSSSVGAQIKRTGDYGFVKGDLKLSDVGYCRMENISVDADILENDEIVTSSLGEIFPAGITIGYVKEIHMDSSGLSKQALIQPIVDFSHLDTVLIINQLTEPLPEDELLEKPEPTPTP